MEAFAIWLRQCPIHSSGGWITVILSNESLRWGQNDNAGNRYFVSRKKDRISACHPNRRFETQQRKGGTGHRKPSREVAFSIFFFKKKTNCIRLGNANGHQTAAFRWTCWDFFFPLSRICFVQQKLQHAALFCVFFNGGSEMTPVCQMDLLWPRLCWRPNMVGSINEAVNDGTGRDNRFANCSVGKLSVANLGWRCKQKLSTVALSELSVMEITSIAASCLL